MSTFRLRRSIPRTVFQSLVSCLVLVQCSVGEHSFTPCTAFAIGDERGRTARLRVVKVRSHHAAPSPITLAESYMADRLQAGRSGLQMSSWPGTVIPRWRTSSSSRVGVSKASAFRFVSRTVCSPYPTLNLRRLSISSRRCTDLEQHNSISHLLHHFPSPALTWRHTSSNSVTRNYCCRAREVTLSFMDTLIALTYLLLVIPHIFLRTALSKGTTKLLFCITIASCNKTVLLPTNATPVCVCLILILSMLCPVTDISATVTSNGVKTICTMIHISAGHKVSPLGMVPQKIPKIRKFWPSEREYLENDKSQRYMPIRA